MKPSFPSPLMFLWLVLAAVSAPCVVRGTQVLDTAGNPVQPGVPYYIVPAKGGNGGGLVPSSRTFNVHKLCPLDVVQSPFPFIPGIPVVFTPQTTTDGSVQVNTNFNVQFETTVWLCPQSKVWKWDHDSEIGYSFISTGGAIGDELSWFRVWTEGDAYKFLWCNKGTECYYVGTYNDGLGVSRLVISNGFLPVKFQKVSEANIAPQKKTMLRMLPVTE